ncbi:MAG: hypothetical protein AAF533_00065 [Acidobacteriota bacterium]
MSWSPPDLLPFFDAWVDRAGRLVDALDPVETLLPPPSADDDDLYLGSGSTTLRLRHRDLRVLAGCLAFREDEQIRGELDQPPGEGDLTSVSELIAEFVPDLAGLHAIEAPTDCGATLKLDFTVAGFEPSQVFLLETEDAEAAEPPARPQVAADEESEPVEPITTTAAPDFLPSDDAGRSEAGSPSGRFTALVVDVREDRRASLVNELTKRRWRVLGPQEVRSVLNWALVERVVDVVVLDPDWPHAPLLRQNLGSHPATATLPVIGPPSGSPASYLETMIEVAQDKRRAD